MPTLGELIGALLADATSARVSADVEAVKVAQRYSQDELMRHLPVPRFRLPEITVELPVLVTSVRTPAAKSAGVPLSAPTAAELGKAVADGLAASGVQVSRTQVGKASTAVGKRSRELFADGDGRLLTPQAVTRDLTETVVQAVRLADTGVDEVLAVRRATGAALSALLTSKLLQAPSLQVQVAASELKSHADDASVVRVRLTISEDAYEVVERDDGAGFSLTPE